MLWINFLHFYQPGNANEATIKEATEKSYLRIIAALEKNPQVRFTTNINGCLIQRWENLGLNDLLRRIKALVDKKQLELVGTASFHPLLPLMPASEIKAQIAENETILKKHFGPELELKGFFMPEMAYGVNAAKIIKKCGYKYLILGEVALTGKIGSTDCSKIYEDENSGLKIIIRNRADSQNYVPSALLSQPAIDDNRIMVTATDAELYGLRNNDLDGNFEKLLSRPELKTTTISDYMEGKDTEKCRIIPSSWESTEEEINSGQPYALWADKNNPVHTLLWKAARLALATTKKFSGDKNDYWARWHLVRGLASCTFWWASGRDFRKVFGPVAWSPDEIARGADDLARAVRSLDNPASKQAKLKMEKLNLKIIKLIWEAHWNNHWNA